MTHACPELLAEAVYGLLKIDREKLKSANFIAESEFYPTSVILGLFPIPNLA